MSHFSADRWQQVEALLDEVLELPAAARMPYLEKACAGDATLLEEVRSLLAEEDQALTFLNESATQFAAPLLPGLKAELAAQAEAQSLTGQRLGNYRVLRELGRGGMGTVYLASRDDGQFQNKVALKVVHAGRNSADVRRRFLYERQILATLNHPNIARLYDGGVTEDDLPFFVMEYVEGMPITAYCDAHRLTTEARLALFRTVCRAVQYAHQNLVIHRDLKPSNILVTEEGTVKLLDFGIAKLLTEDAEQPDTPVTQVDVRVMTPEYASPEQIRGEPITTATDVYQLGLLLYELLTGQQPYQWSSTVRYKLERAIAEQTPKRPSALITALHRNDPETQPTDVSTAELAQRRGTSVEKLRRRLSGDLDRIVLMALKKAPTERYETVEQLSEDIRRHLVGLPVSAHGEALSYRMRKFASRHRGAVIAAALVFLSLMGGLFGTAWQAQRATKALAQAEAKAAEAEAVASFLADLFREADPWESPADTLTVRQVLDQGAKKIHGALRDQPAARAALLNVLGDIYTGLGTYPEAESFLTEALQTLAETGQAEGTRAQTLSYLGALKYYKGHYTAAESLQVASLNLRRRLYGLHHKDVAQSMDYLGLVRQELGDYQQAAALFDSALVINRHLHGEPSREVADNLSNLADTYEQMGEHAKAEALLREALAMRRALYGEANHPDVAIDLNSLGITVMSLSRHEEAIDLFEASIVMDQALFGESHPTIGNTLGNLALALNWLERYDESETFRHKSIKMLRDWLGDDHPDVSVGLANLATLYHEMGNYPAAESLYVEVLGRTEQHYGRHHQYLALDYFNLSVLYYDIKAYEKAQVAVDSSLAIYLRTVGQAHPNTASAHVHLAHIMMQQDEHEAAIPLFRTAIPHLRKAYGQPDWRVADAASSLGACLKKLKQYEEAELLLRNSLAELTETLGEDDSYTAYARRHLVELYEAIGQPALAETYRY